MQPDRGAGPNTPGYWLIQTLLDALIQLRSGLPLESVRPASRAPSNPLARHPDRARVHRSGRRGMRPSPANNARPARRCAIGSSVSHSRRGFLARTLGAGWLGASLMERAALRAAAATFKALERT